MCWEGWAWPGALWAVGGGRRLCSLGAWKVRAKDAGGFASSLKSIEPGVEPLLHSRQLTYLAEVLR